MGFTTIIELNHDFADEIERDPQKFVREVLDHIKQGTQIFDDAGIRIAGGTIVSTFHRSNNDFDRIWIEYKLELRRFLKYLRDKSAEMKQKGIRW
jgi:hypothetical protein